MRHLRILHVEDNREDAFLLARVCESANLPADFHEVSGGLDAMAYLKGEGDFANRTVHPVPDVIVLDLEMPGMDGFEFLCWLRRDPGFRYRDSGDFLFSPSEAGPYWGEYRIPDLETALDFMRAV